jgi:hypothetical protein
MVEYKRSIDLMKSQITNEHVKLTLKNCEDQGFQSTIAKFLI